MIQEGAWWIEGSTYSSFVRSHNKLHQNQDWIKKRSGHDVSSTYMLEVFRGKDQISNYNLLMHSPVGSGTLTRKKDWVKDLCTFSIIYFIGKWMLTISKARDYELFSFFVYLDFFFRDYLFLKKIKKKINHHHLQVFWAKRIHLPCCGCLNAISCPAWQQFLLQLWIFCCLLVFAKHFPL